MFETAELGHKVSKSVFTKQEAELRKQLLDVQYELLEQKGFSVVVVVGGVEAGGKGETVNQLHEWMDPRHLHTIALPPESDAERPRLYPYWQKLPPVGKIGMYIGSWYTQPILDRAYRRSKWPELDRAMHQNTRFERMLTSERVLVIKFWFHLSKKAQKDRLKSLSKDKLTSWRITDTEWERFGMYDRLRAVSERALRNTSTGFAPWYVVESTDERYRHLTVGRILHQAIRKRLDETKHNTSDLTPPLTEPIDKLRILDTLDLSQSVAKDKYESRLAKLQGKLNGLMREPAMKERSVIAVFEGADAAGKGGAIRRITYPLDARQYRVVPVAAPTEEERARPYLWRFWRHVPKWGHVSIFDRSWYGRVLVERIEGFCDEDDWMRAYNEINDFEESLADSGAIVIKYWLQISQEEQLKRFEERSLTAYKQFKLGPEDWRNREKWDAYQRAASEMIGRTSTERAPWVMVAANDKRHARLHVLEELIASIERAIK